MSAGNGHDKVVDEGLIAIQSSFSDAKFLNSLGRQCAQLMQMGAHREFNIPDAIIMEVYGIVTEGANVEIKFQKDSGHGFKAQIESYADLIAFMKGEHPCEEMELGSESG